MGQVAIASGPTGGHLLPALLTAREFERRGVNTHLYSSAPQDHPILEEYGANYSRVRFESWPPGSVADRCWCVPELLLRSSGLLGSLGKETALVSFGGYSTVPVVLAALARGLDLYLHEQNRIPGKVTMLASPFAREVFYGLPPLKRGAERSYRLVGNPVRQPCDPVERWYQEPLLVVAGGSQGSLEVSEKLQDCGAAILERGWNIFYLRGKFGKDLEAEFSSYTESFRQQKFTHELPGLLARSNCVWTRAGAGTLSELIALDRPALLFPLESSAASHQELNCDWLSEHGPARQGTGMSADEIVEATVELAATGGRYEVPDSIRGEAEKKIVEEVQKISGILK